MKRVAVFVAVGVAGALIGGVGVGVASAGSGGEQTGPRRAVAAVAAVNDAAVETHFVALAPCALVDTRTAGGVLAPNAIRQFRASGTTGFGAQGGKAGGCGVPDAASAVQVVVTAVGASGRGTLRASSPTSPLGTFMNYTSAFDVTGGGAIALTSGRFRLQDLTATTNVHVDVLGYYVPPIWAHVGSDGTLVSGSRIVSSTRLDVGRFQLVVDRDVSGCGVTAQSTGFDQSDIWLQTVENTITVDVELPATANSQDDDEVYVVVAC